MIASSSERLQAEVGPCPQCLDGMVDLWLRHDTDIQSCLLLLWKKSRTYQIVQCNACEFWMGIQDYRHLQRSSTAWGVEALSKRFLIDGDTQSSCCSEITDTSQSDSNNDGQNGLNSYVSLARLMEINKKEDTLNHSRTCRCCNKQLQEAFRFCPQCGMFVDSLVDRSVNSFE